MRQHAPRAGVLPVFRTKGRETYATGHDDSANAAAGGKWRIFKVQHGASGLRMTRMPLIAPEFGLEPCGDPVSGEGPGPDAFEKGAGAPGRARRHR